MGKQKRSENTYQKINTIFYRDEKNIIMPYDEFVEPEFNYLRGLKWRGEEKIDGTNIRLEVTSLPVYAYANPMAAEEGELAGVLTGVEFHVAYKGKTDNAQMPKELDAYLKATYPAEKVLESLGLKEFIPVEEFVDHKWENIDQVPTKYTIYGEGYGRGIQKAGSHYIKNGVGFIVFDVKVNEIYLLTESRDEIAAKLGAPVVPYMGHFTLDEAIEFVRKGFKSTIAEDADFMSEGLVLRTDLGLKNRMGKRLIVKVKYEDFNKYLNAYGTDDKVEQTRNTHMS